MQILVTGATGFIGTHLVNRLLSENQQVRCLARNTSVRPAEFADRVEWVIGDLQDKESLIKATAGVDEVFHLAGAIAAQNAFEFLQINTYGTENLLSAMTENANPNARFVYVSSLSAGGPASALKPNHEDDPAFPVSAYGNSKLAAEIALLRQKEKIHVTIIRPAIVYGPGDRETLRLFKFAKNHIVPRMGLRNSFFSMIYVDDLVQMMWLASRSNLSSGEIFYAADQRDEGYSVSEIIKITAQILNTWTVPIIIPKSFLYCSAAVLDFWSKLARKQSLLNRDKYREMIQKYWVCSSEKAQRLLGYEPKTTLIEGVQKTILWYKEKNWI